MPKTVSISVKFILRKNPEKPGAICPIEAVIYKNKVDYRFAIGMGARVADWDGDKQRFSTSVKNPIEKRERTELNDLLGEWDVRLRAIWNDYHKPDFSGIPKPQMTRQRWIGLVNERLGKGKAPAEIPTFTDHVRQEIEAEIKAWKEATKRTDWKANNTLQTKLTFYKLILLYQKTAGKIEWPNINAQTVQAFQAWLFRPCEGEIKLKIADLNKSYNRPKKAFSKSSANTHLILLKGFLKSATLKGYLSSKALEEVRLVRSESGKADKFFYHWREVKQLIEADLSTDKKGKLHQCRILMCVGFFTGMREGDWPKLRHEYIVNDYLNVITDKKGARVGIPLLPVFKSILEITGFNLPSFPTNSALNTAIKQLAKASGIDRVVMVQSSEGGISHPAKPSPFWKETSSHDCRRTAGQMLLAFGVSMDTVRRLLGHSTEGQTGEYVADNTFASAEFNNDAEKQSLRGFLQGEVDLRNFAKNHAEWLGKLGKKP